MHVISGVDVYVIFIHVYLYGSHHHHHHHASHGMAFNCPREPLEVSEAQNGDRSFHANNFNFHIIYI